MWDTKGPGRGLLYPTSLLPAPAHPRVLTLLLSGGPELRADLLGVRAERGHRAHHRLLPGRLDGREQRVDLSRWGADRAPAATGAQLRVLGQFPWRPEPGAGDPGLFECP